MISKKVTKSEMDTAAKTLDLIQELVWAIRSREPRDLAQGISLLRDLTKDINQDELKFKGRTSLSSKKKYNLQDLVGILPLILADTELFPANKDIAKFAEEAMHISISRWDKRSRYEMIGMLVMESMHAQPKILAEVVSLLNQISNEADSMEKIKKSSQQIGFTWNEAIRTLRRSNIE